MRFQVIHQAGKQAKVKTIRRRIFFRPLDFPGQDGETILQIDHKDVKDFKSMVAWCFGDDCFFELGKAIKSNSEFKTFSISGSFPIDFGREEISGLCHEYRHLHKFYTYRNLISKATALPEKVIILLFESILSGEKPPEWAQLAFSIRKEILGLQ